MIGELSYILSTAVLGIFLGAQICEGVLFVPFWKAMQPKDFFDLHQTYGKKIYQFFAPLTIIATLIPISTSILAYFLGVKGCVFALLMGIFTLLFFSTYFLFFKSANHRFATASISYEALPGELNRWEKWHWGRIGLETIAFICSLIALSIV